LKTIANICNIQIKNSYNIYVKHIHHQDKTLVMSRSKLEFGLNQSEVPEKKLEIGWIGARGHTYLSPAEDARWELCKGCSGKKLDGNTVCTVLLCVPVVDLWMDARHPRLMI
jgi:hypothetical protein